MERWAIAPGYPDYEISDQGRVRRIGTKRGAQGGKVLRPYTKESGHRAITLRIDETSKNVRIARLVCMAFVGPVPFPKAEACHINGVHNDDRWDNLEWGTSAKNKADMVRHGTRRMGEAHWSSVLTDEHAAEIKELGRTRSMTQREIGERYGVAQSHVSRLLSGNRRSGVPCDEGCSERRLHRVRGGRT